MTVDDSDFSRTDSPVPQQIPSPFASRPVSSQQSPFEYNSPRSTGRGFFARKKLLVGAVVVAFGLVGAAAAVWLVQNNQDIRQQASVEDGGVTCQQVRFDENFDQEKSAWISRFSPVPDGLIFGESRRLRIATMPEADKGTWFKPTLQWQGDFSAEVNVGPLDVVPEQAHTQELWSTYTRENDARTFMIRKYVEQGPTAYIQLVSVKNGDWQITQRVEVPADSWNTLRLTRQGTTVSGSILKNGKWQVIGLISDVSTQPVTPHLVSFKNTAGVYSAWFDNFSVTCPPSRDPVMQTEWNFNETAQGFIEDEVTGQRIENDVQQVDGPFPKAGSAIRISSPDAVIPLEDGKEVDTVNSYTISSWIKLSRYNDYWQGFLFSKLNVQQGEGQNVTWRGMAFGVRGTRDGNPDLHKRLILVVNGPNNLGTSYTHVFGKKIIPLDEWHHVAAVFNRETSTVSLYLDGNLEVSKQVALPELASNVKDANIGGKVGWNQDFFNGDIDEFKIFGKALTPEEIVEEMARVMPDPVVVDPDEGKIKVAFRLFEDTNENTSYDSHEKGINSAVQWERNGDDNWTKYYTHTNRSGQGDELANFEPGDKVKLRVGVPSGYEFEIEDKEYTLSDEPAQVIDLPLRKMEEEQTSAEIAADALADILKDYTLTPKEEAPVTPSSVGGSQYTPSKRVEDVPVKKAASPSPTPRAVASPRASASPRVVASPSSQVAQRNGSNTQNRTNTAATKSATVTANEESAATGARANDSEDSKPVEKKGVFQSIGGFFRGIWCGIFGCKE